MKNIYLSVVLFGAFAGNLNASGIIACYDGVNGDPTNLRAGNCATQNNFSTLPPNDFLDWGSLGTAHNNTYTPTTNAPWDALSNGGLIAGLNLGPGFTGAPTLIREDNGLKYKPGSTWTIIPSSLATMFNGHFNSIPNAGAGAPYGDHLVGFQNAQGPLEIQFSAPITSVGFHISTVNSTSVDATVKAYDIPNPTSSDIPILSYRVTDTGGGGACAGLNSSPPVPCNDAPFLAIDGINQQFTTIIISATDNSGFFIDGLYLETLAEDQVVPEPASRFLIGGGMLLLGIGSRKLRARARC